MVGRGGPHVPFIVQDCISVSGQDEPTESRAMSGYTSGQDVAILPARDTGFVPQGKFIMFRCFIPYNKFFIDQACSVKIAGYWPRSFFACSWTSTSSRPINTQKKKKRIGKYSAILTSRLVNDPYVSPQFMISKGNHIKFIYLIGRLVV